MALDEATKQVIKGKSKFVNALQTRYSRGCVAFRMLSWRERKCSIASGIVMRRVWMGGRGGGGGKSGCNIVYMLE